MQNQLNALYRRFVEISAVYHTLGRTEDTERLLTEVDGPFLIAANEDYEAAEPRVVIVGQENNGWIGQYREFFQKYTLGQAVEYYAGFWRDQPYNVCFFQMISQLRHDILGQKALRHALLWLNLFKFNQGRNPQMIYSAHMENVLKWQADVVQEEIRILRPDVVIFLTGPAYNRILERFYPDAEFREIDGHPTREVAAVCAQSLPALTFRTYHPNYFRRIMKRKPYCYQAIIDRIREAYPQPHE